MASVDDITASSRKSPPPRETVRMTIRSRSRLAPMSCPLRAAYLYNGNAGIVVKGQRTNRKCAEQTSAKEPAGSRMIRRGRRPYGSHPASRGAAARDRRASAGSARTARTAWISPGSSTVAIKRRRPPHRGQARTSISNARCMNPAQDQWRCVRSAGACPPLESGRLPGSEVADSDDVISRALQLAGE